MDIDRIKDREIIMYKNNVLKAEVKKKGTR